MAAVEVKVPDIGDFDAVEVIEVLVKAGDRIKPEQSLVTVESDKASMEIPSSVAGVVKEMRVKVGDKVSEGSTLLMVEGAEGSELNGGQSEAGAPTEAPAPSKATAATPSGAAPAPASRPAASPADDKKASGSSTEVVVPDIGDFDEVAVIEVLVKVGDSVDIEQSLITVESDKASMEIPSSAAGTVESVAVAVGDKISKGSTIAVVKGDGGAAAGVAGEPKTEAKQEQKQEQEQERDAKQAEPNAADATPPLAAQPSLAAAPATAAAPGTAASPGASPSSERQLPTAALPAHEPSAPRGPLPHASPSIRKLARELGVPLDEVQGSGPKGRITQDDVQAFVKAVMAGSQATRAQASRQAPAGGASGSGSGAWAGLPAWPQVDFAKFGPVERKDLSRIRRISGPALLRNWVSIPHVTNHDDADITDLEAFRVATNKEGEKSGVKVTMLAFLVKASVAALVRFPEFNASLESTSAGEQIVLKRYFHIGFAADTPNGLVVPVVRDCDKKGVLQISREMSELARKARDGKLSPAEMSGGCFSISSLGGIGGRYFTPIINAPEVAILGVCRSATEPKWDGDSFRPRLMLPLSLSWDHRVIDGAAAARFNAFLVQILGDFRRVLL